MQKKARIWMFIAAVLAAVVVLALLILWKLPKGSVAYSTARWRKTGQKESPQARTYQLIFNNMMPKAAEQITKWPDGLTAQEWSFYVDNKEE